MKFEIQAADDVIAVALARIEALNISTGYAHDNGPIPEEKKKLKIPASGQVRQSAELVESGLQVMATNAPAACMLLLPAGKIAIIAVPMTNVRPENFKNIVSRNRRYCAVRTTHRIRPDQRLAPTKPIYKHDTRNLTEDGNYRIARLQQKSQTSVDANGCKYL
jgi:hypothetical protein